MCAVKNAKAESPNSRSPAPVVAATIDYEDWLRSEVNVIEADLLLKHRLMAASCFAFLRGTFYRWASLFKEVCVDDLYQAPRVLAVGDLHVENFGTWRDNEGRLVWGVNDFDEVAEMPYAVDLVRLVTSVILAERESKFAIKAGDAAAAVLEGYTEFLNRGGKPFILEERHPNLRGMALGAERDPVKFWSKLTSLPSLTPPKHERRLLANALPNGTAEIIYSHRVAGEGSLGRPRYVATGSCNGGLVAREAKAWLPSAWGWAKGKPKERVHALRLLKRSVRQPDPYYTIEGGYVVRRIGPHCGRIELADFPKQRDERLILTDMGRETANLHLATPRKRAKVLHDLDARKANWLINAAQAMASATTRDWEEFRSSRLGKPG
jgi:hypothetical protein